MRKQKNHIVWFSVFLFSLLLNSCGGGNSGGGTPTPITSSDMGLLNFGSNARVIATFTDSESGGIIRYSNIESTSTTNGLRPGIHYTIDSNLDYPYPSEIILERTFTPSGMVFNIPDTETRNENLVSFKRGQFEIDEGGNLYRVYTYNVKKQTDGENLGVAAQFIATEVDSTSWIGVNNYVAQVSGSNIGTLPSGTYEYEGLTIASDRINGSWYGEQPFQMTINFAKGTGIIGKKLNSRGTFSPPNSTEYNNGEIILNGELRINMTDGTFTGTNLSFMSVEEIRNADSGIITPMLRYDSNDNNFATISLHGSFHGVEGEGVSGVFHDNNDSPTIIGAIIGRQFLPPALLQVDMPRSLPNNDGGQIYYYEDRNNRNHFRISHGDTLYPSAPIRRDGFMNTNRSDPFIDGKYDHLNRTSITTGEFNFDKTVKYVFGSLSVKGNDPVSDDPNSNENILKKIYTEIVGIADNEFTLNDGHSWELRVGGPPIMDLPTGSFEYGGLVTIMDKSENAQNFKDNPNVRVGYIQQPLQQLANQYIFDLNANFDTNIGQIGVHNQHRDENLTNKLSGEFTINPTDGTFEGHNLDLNDTSKASLYGSFFGATAEGVGGVFHGITDTNIVGSIIGGQKDRLHKNYADLN